MKADSTKGAGDVGDDDAPHGNSTAHPRGSWHEDYGPVLWWKFPITEPPFAGTPLDEDFPDYATHWTPIVVPQDSKQGDEPKRPAIDGDGPSWTELANSPDDSWKSGNDAVLAAGQGFSPGAWSLALAVAGMNRRTV